jgi:hypothetical protein
MGDGVFKKLPVILAIIVTSQNLFETRTHDLNTNSAGVGCKEFKRPFDLPSIVFHDSTSPMIFLFFWRGQ